MKTKLRLCVLPLILFLLILISSFSFADAEAFSVKRIGNLIPFNDNAFLVNAPEEGKLTIRIHDDLSVYRILEQTVKAGKTTIHWDGCAFNHEKLAAKNYTITAILSGLSGKEYKLSFNTPVEYTGQCLQYLLPSSKQASLAEPDEWFVEFRTVQKGVVTFVFQSVETGTEQVFSVNTTGGRINRLSFADMTGRTILPTGTYHVVAYENSKKEESFEFDITIQENPFTKEDIFLTGEIIPDELMSEQEIWQIMQQPSVIVDIDFFKHQKVFKERDTSSPSLGTLHGQTQALKVIKIENDWAFIGAWNHEEAEYIEGWVPVSSLRVVEPDPDYGILISKKKQTMDIYYRGKRIETLEISTGRPEEKHPGQETAAGSFLTGYHRVDFSTNGKKYDYVIQYDGGNLLHQIPYEWGKDKKDFSLGRAFLGAKASHACIRIQSEPGENGINAYWIWTHIPYHTRVLIMDDPDERRPVTERPKVVMHEIEKNDGQFGIILKDETWDEKEYPVIAVEVINGHMIGIARCNEKEYIKNPEVVSERVGELLEMGCCKIILKCFWSGQNQEKHTAIQESMARKGIKAGADLVVGNGNRSLLGCENRDNGMILYGLGNYRKRNAGKKNTDFSLTAEIIFDQEKENSRPTVILQPAHAEADMELIAEHLAADSIGQGIGQVYLCPEVQ